MLKEADDNPLGQWSYERACTPSGCESCQAFLYFTIKLKISFILKLCYILHS